MSPRQDSWARSLANEPANALYIAPERLGSPAFRQVHQARLAYVAGSMYKGVSSEEMVARMGAAGLLSYFGTGGLRPERLDSAISRLQSVLPPAAPYGMNLLANPANPEREAEAVRLFLARGVRRVEAAAFIRITPALVRYRVTGLSRGHDGSVRPRNLVLAKVSRPETATNFLRPAPSAVLEVLARRGEITAEEADLAAHLPMADDICAEADSGGHTDQRPLVTMLPDMVHLRDAMASAHRMDTPVRVGVAGGLGTPGAIAAAFVMGADFVLTGSINQCTVESGTSDRAKEMLAQAGIQDTAIVPAGDMLEIGAKAQVLRRGLLFPARANRLFELYVRHDSLEEIDERTTRQIEDRMFRRPIAEVWSETAAYLRQNNPEELERAEQDPKVKMALVFKWYFVHSTRLAMDGSADQQVDYQVPCGPAMGALNSLLSGTPLQDWRARHVDELADLLMSGAARLLTQRLTDLYHDSTGHEALPDEDALAVGVGRTQ